MRKLLEAIALLALIFNLGFTACALWGPNALPARIPTHFDITGSPDGFGTPRMLLLLPLIAIFLYSLISLVSRRPAAFNYPARITAQNKSRLQRLAVEMIAFLKAEVLTLFALIQFFSIRTARLGENALPAALMPCALVLIFLTITLYILAMRRTAVLSPETK
jgi:uncharacterized membrane protein